MTVKRDWDLVKAILLHVAAQPGQQYTRLMALAGTDAATTAAHAKLLIDADFIDGIATTIAGETIVRTRRLLPSGHELLDNSRDDEAWAKAKRIAEPESDVIVPEAFLLILRTTRRATKTH
jgi:hypothetical protein